MPAPGRGRSLDVGCGSNKRADVGMDISPGPGVDVVHDAAKAPWPFPDASFDRIESHQLIEHLPPPANGAKDALITVFDEAWRVLKPGGMFLLDTPHVHARAARGDPTHYRYYDEDSFRWLWTPQSHPHIARRLWTLKSLNIERTWGTPESRIHAYHFQKYLPTVYRVLSALRFGRPGNLILVLQKP